MMRSKTEEVIGLDKKQQWERDRQIVLAQLHNLMLALRSNTKFSSRLRFVQAAMEPQHHLMTLVKNLREALFQPEMEELPEDEILTPFCEVALSEETTEPITGVALAAFVTFLDLKCSFLTKQSLMRLADCASNSRSEIADAQSHEAVLARILQVYVGCARHPAAHGLLDTHIIGMLERAYAVSTHGDPSELLRRTAEQAMNDIVTAVFYRIVEECQQSLLASQSIADGVYGASASTLDHQHHNTAAEAPPTAAAHGGEGSSNQIRSGAAIVQYICKLIMCNVALPAAAPAGQNAVSVAAVQLQGLCLAHTALFILKDALRLPQCLPLLRYVRNDLCRALLSIGTRTENIIVLSQLLRTAHLVVQFASVAVVPQALSIIKSIHLSPMQASMEPVVRGGASGSAQGMVPARTPLGTNGGASFSSSTAADDLETREMHEMLIESLLEFCSDHSFATFCFVHYDLSLHYPPMLENLCHFLARHCFHQHHGSTSSFAASPMSKPPSSPTSSPTSGLTSPSQLTAPGAPPTPPPATVAHLNQINILAFDSLMGLLLAVAKRAAASASDENTHEQNGEAIRRAIDAKLEHKRHIMTFAEKFAANPLKEGIQYYIQTRQPRDDELSGWEVGEFLFEHRAVLDKNVLGEYLGELGKEPLKPDSADQEATVTWEAARVDDHKKPGTCRFFERQLRGFLHGFQFQNKELLMSIREMVFQMRLPGEAQKIDRVMQAFAEHWYLCNRNSGPKINPFKSEDAAFILSFSIIMLNTDLHSGKLDKTMTKEQFRSMNRGIDNGDNVPDAYLNVVFDAVKGEQIIMIDMVRQGHEYDTVWNMEMAEARQQAHDSLLVVGMRGNSTPDLRPFDPFVFRTLWRPTLIGLAAVFEGCSTRFSVDRSVQTTDQMTHYLKRRCGKDFVVFHCALRGLRTIVELGASFEVHDAVDHVILTLLQHAPLSLQNGYSNLQMLGRSPSTLFAIELLFEVLFKHAHALRDSWKDVATFLHKAFLLGLFAKHHDSSFVSTSSGVEENDALVASRSYSEVIREEGDAGSPQGANPLDSISTVLLCNPGIVGPHSARLQLQTTDGSWFGGWFASNAQSEAKRKERELDDAATLRRIASAVPHMQSIMDGSIDMPDAAFKSFVHGLCFNDCTAMDAPAGGFAASFALHLTLEVVLANLHRVALVETNVFESIHSQLTAAYGCFEQAKEASRESSRPNLAAGGAGGAAAKATPAAKQQSASTRAVVTMEHWRNVAARMTDAVLRLVCALARSPKHHAQMLHLLTMLVELPHDILSAVVAQPLSVALYVCIVERSPADGVFQMASPTAWNQLLYVVHVVGVMAPYAEVRARMVAVLLSIVKSGTYDATENTQRLAHALVSNILAPTVTSQEVPQDWMSITSFDSTPYVSVQTPLRSTRDLQLKELEARVPEALVVAYKRLVALCRDERPWSAQDKGATWFAAWMFVLSGLVTFVVSARQQRIASDALLCLQRCVLDTDLLCLPLSAVLEVFHQLIFPLTEKLCSENGVSASKLAALAGNQGTASASSSVTPAKQLVASSLSFLSPSVLMSTVFGPLAGPDGKGDDGYPAAPASVGAEDGSTAAHLAARAATEAGATPVAVHVNEEMQCRAISLLPKTFLHYLYIITNPSNNNNTKPLQGLGTTTTSTGPFAEASALESLWKRIMGTLYAMYTSTCQPHHNQKGTHRSEDPSMLKEAIQENVKNLVYVLAATVQVPEHKGLLTHHPNFWQLTIELVKPFDFGDALVKHIVTSRLL